MSESAPIDVASEIARLGGGDRFGDVLRAAERHRAEHAGCTLYPAGPWVMQVVAQLVRATDPASILDLGTGFGYSALWLAHGAAASATVTAIDRDPWHIAEAQRFAAVHDRAARLDFIVGEVVDVLPGLEHGVDLIHDDAWFARRPDHLDAVIELLRPGGVLTMANWFLLEDALTYQPRRDWSEFAGSGWADDVRAYAEGLAADQRLDVVWLTAPPLGIAVKRRR